jgi:hypothetical protein
LEVTVHFVDGEELDGEAEHVALDRGGFNLVGVAGNTRSAWVGAGAIKYIVLRGPTDPVPGDSDPRQGSDLTKIVLHFLDGEIQHTYRDEVYTEQPGGFMLRLWDARSRQLHLALVPGSSLKGVFVVDQWDSRASPQDADSREPQAGVSPPAPVAIPSALVAAGETEPEPGEDDLYPRDAPDTRLVLASHYDAEERRPGFGSGLTRRRQPPTALTPEQERHLSLRLRISEVLGALYPDRADEGDAD